LTGLKSSILLADPVSALIFRHITIHIQSRYLYFFFFYWDRGQRCRRFGWSRVKESGADNVTVVEHKFFDSCKKRTEQKLRPDVEIEGGKRLEVG
jgi:hypothetical protein